MGGWVEEGRRRMMSGGSGESGALSEAFGRWIRGCGLGWVGMVGG